VLGRVDILVNNAGIQITSPVVDFPEDAWDRILAVNLSSAFHATKALLPGMLGHGWGRVVNIASAHGLVASPFKAAYVAAKHGLVGFTKAVALEVAQSAVTCNAICPGFVRTPLAEVQVARLAEQHGVSADVALRDHLLAKQPSRRWVEVEEVARMALYLCGPGSGAVNGAALSIDGGWAAA
jgi:3-hydroxybutyrate dehydrogenase